MKLIVDGSLTVFDKERQPVETKHGEYYRFIYHIKNHTVYVVTTLDLRSIHANVCKGFVSIKEIEEDNHFAPPKWLSIYAIEECELIQQIEDIVSDFEGQPEYQIYSQVTK